MNFAELKKRVRLEPARVYTGLALVALVVLLAIFHTPFVVYCVLGVGFLVGFYEAHKLYTKAVPTPLLWALAALCWASVWPLGSPLGFCVALVVLAGYQAYTRRGTLAHAMAFIYPGMSVAFMYALYLEHTVTAALWLICVVSFTDIFAYFGGRIFGGKFFANPAFCPSSPNKTKEGVLLGIVGATMIGSLVGLGTVSFVPALLCSLLASVASVFGDLYESYLKRAAGVKDSGACLPGHGGVLDRFDGYFFASVALYAMLEFGALA